MSVKIIAHRGANRLAPQNTLPAFAKAFELRADGLETDVHLTQDGVPVICHNYEIDETSNGRGSISKMTLETFKSYDFGSYFGDAFKDTPAPTLAELLALCAEQSFEILNIELKPSRENDVSVVGKTIDLVKEYGLSDRLLISSFSTHMLTQAKKLDRHCETALLYSPNRREFYRMLGREDRFALALGVSALHPWKNLITPLLVKKAHAAGIKINAWTVNSASDLIRYANMGVDGLITDVPDEARKILTDAGFCTEAE